MDTTKRIKGSFVPNLLFQTQKKDLFEFEKLVFDLSAYHQSRFDKVFSTPRLASSSEVLWNFTEYFGMSLIYQNIYDYAPVVPIRKDFHKIIFGISVNF